ncbi:MAG: hypothetical protein CVU48_09830 [Candidatus Cloacimonetes bacterium HGW-Cloacimonetes-1]|jgi:serine phosphatase RsbU (regulator of sigma subunit)|nr:MAG: hypothetical protein CVU48_09830 [Candidatus Cloacimonetes bacterium HGW-Cloacimonetes-1]
MYKAFIVLAIVLVSGLTISYSQTAETTQALEEYKQIVEENRSYRTYGAESGLKGNTTYQFSDADRYRWYTSDHEGFRVYRFNGIRFMDVFSGEMSTARDTMLPVLVQSVTTSNIYTAGIRNLYEWQNNNWKKYAFPKNDRILQLKEYNGDVYCIGERGIASLKQGSWVYRTFKNKITEAEASRADVSKSGIVYSLSVKSREGLTSVTSIFVKQFSSLNTGLMPIAQNLLTPTPPQTCFDHQKEVMWIYFAQTDILFKYNLKNMLVQKVSFKPGESIQNISTTDNGKNWLITKTSDIIKAVELTADYPKSSGMGFNSTKMTFNPAYLDYLYLEGQLMPISSDKSLAKNYLFSRIRILEPNPQTRILAVKEFMIPFQGSVCKQVYNYGNLLLMDVVHEGFLNVSRVLILKYPFERITSRDIIIETESYTLNYNRLMDSILIQREGKISLVPLVIICERVATGSNMQMIDGTKPNSAIDKEAFFDNHNLHYHYQNAWHKMDIGRFEMYGKPVKALTLNGIFWLCFENALLRFDPKLKTSYAYTAREGIPEGMLAINIESGKLMISTKEATYKFNEYQNILKLDIPYIIVSDSIKVIITNKLILPYTQRRLEIPISILGPLYPDLCPVSYRLLGYNDDWITKGYLERIRYLKLPYGSYTFEVSARAANGLQTSVKSFPFKIKAPFYYTWYAYTVYIIGALLIMFLIFRWRVYSYREANRQLELQVAERTRELQEWQLRMTQSIDYALLIQKSILPQENQLLRLFKEHLILWHPRDTVGGDFYWLHELPAGDAFLFALIDCTGHGVPGALVSMTVNSALNHIVKDHGINTPEDILKQLHQDIGRTLHQESEKTQQDGLDIALLKVNFTTKILSFAGAAMDILIYQQNSPELTILKGSNNSIGGLKHQKNLIFKPQQVEYSPNTIVYLYTDGILDQIYEIKTRMKRLGPVHWCKIVGNMVDKPLAEQKVELEDLVTRMLILDDQRDDITIVGLMLD